MAALRDFENPTTNATKAMKKTIETAAVVSAQSADATVSPWKGRGSNTGRKRNIAGPAKAPAKPADTRSAEKQALEAAVDKHIADEKARRAKNGNGKAKKAPAPRTRGKNESRTFEIAGIGAIELSPTDIAKAGAVWTAIICPLLKQWVGLLKSGTDRGKDDKGNPLPKFPRSAAFKHLVEFGAASLTIGGGKQAWRPRRAAMIAWSRENGPQFRKSLNPLMSQVHDLQVKLCKENGVELKDVITLNGDAPVRFFKRTLCMSVTKEEFRSTGARYTA